MVQLAKKGLQMELYKPKIGKALVPSDPKPGRLYGMIKYHKDIPPGHKLPPIRPVVSGCGSNSETLSAFLDFYLKPCVKKLDSYIEDTNEFLLFIEEMKNENLPLDVIPVSIDVIGLYSSIPHCDAINAVKKTLEERQPEEKDSMPTHFLIEILIMVLSMNTFEFNDKIYKQLFGISMGTRSAPSIANLDFGDREKHILSHDNQHIKRIYKKKWVRYIDDIFLFFQGNKSELNSFMVWLNTLFPTIKFTCSYDFEQRSVEYLDVKVVIDSNGTIRTDLYKKKMSINQYLLPSSFHPKHITKNIPYNVA